MDPELKGMIKDAAQRTHLSQADVMRTALRIGVPEVVKRMEVRKRPRRNFAEYFDVFAGLVKPGKELVAPSRFK
jgi:hypothetical protein